MDSNPTPPPAARSPNWDMSAPARNPRQEYHREQRQRIDQSPSIAKRFPGLKALKVVLSYYAAPGNVKTGEIKCTLNLEHARSFFWFGCPYDNCDGGGFGLSEALASAVSAHRKLATGEQLCAGNRQLNKNQFAPCMTLLRYKLQLDYTPG